MTEKQGDKLVDQPSKAPTRKVAVGGYNGVSAVVGLNLLAEVIMTRAYGGLDQVPETEMRLILYTVSVIPVGWQFLWAYLARSKKGEAP